ncbi:hypothetical protein MTR_7g076885 [Medicago truncatula]|uniref:Uncharacterized protein n=1 Tax=Medicago truncatula TaxID=3880 RepID=A0A072U2I1_MEDTR|nr:hypothetical protein MTR_7g076885 [Medicago truncatula]
MACQCTVHEVREKTHNNNINTSNQYKSEPNNTNPDLYHYKSKSYNNHNSSEANNHNKSESHNNNSSEYHNKHGNSLEAQIGPETTTTKQKEVKKFQIFICRSSSNLSTLLKNNTGFV